MLHYENIPIPEQIVFQKQGSSHSTIRNRKYDQKVKLVNFNESTFNVKDLGL